MTRHGNEPRPALIDERDAARYLGVTTFALRAWRLRRSRTVGPPFIRIGRTIRYRLGDLDEWIEKNRIA